MQRNQNVDILARIELLRTCNLHASEKHPDRFVRERAAGAADCCARLLASFAPDQEEEADDAVEIG